MSLSDDAAKAIAQAAVRDPDWQGRRFTIDKALGAALPDGRTIAQALDDCDVAFAILRVGINTARIGSENGPWTPHSPAADLLRRLENDR